MKKICIQSGHKNMTSGATGATGERDWNIKITDLVASLLKDKAEVYICDAFANKDKKVTETDWDLFIAVHYDADIYKDNGGFVDIPDPSIDYSHKESSRISKIISDYYFTTTGIKSVPRRSNANTKFYYMWSALTKKTPCVIIECGVGWRKPEDYNILRNYDLISKTLAKAISLALNLEEPNKKPTDDLKECKIELSDMRESRNKWKKEFEKKEKEFEILEKDTINLKNDLLETSSELKKSRESINNILKEKSELNAQIERLKEDLTKAGSTIENLVNENRNLVEKINLQITDMKLIDIVKLFIERLKK